MCLHSGKRVLGKHRENFITEAKACTLRGLNYYSAETITAELDLLRAQAWVATARVTQQLLGLSLSGLSSISPGSSQCVYILFRLQDPGFTSQTERLVAEVACATGSITGFKEAFLTVVGKIKCLCR